MTIITKKWFIVRNNYQIPSLFGYENLLDFKTSSNVIQETHGNIKQGWFSLKTTGKTTSKHIDIKVYITTDNISQPQEIIDCKTIADAELLCSILQNIKHSANDNVKFLYCKQCGGKNISTSLKCDNCGATL